MRCRPSDLVVKYTGHALAEEAGFRYSSLTAKQASGRPPTLTVPTKFESMHSLESAVFDIQRSHGLRTDP